LPIPVDFNNLLTVINGYAELPPTTLSEKDHSTVNNTEKEPVRYESGHCVTTNTAEGFFSILKEDIRMEGHDGTRASESDGAQRPGGSLRF
jgi:hypothetical protein